jgi:hypothetical protein
MPFNNDFMGGSSFQGGPLSGRNAPLSEMERGGPFGFSFNAPSWMGQLGMLPQLAMMFSQGPIDQMGMMGGNLFGVNNRSNYYDQMRNRSFFNNINLARQMTSQESQRQISDALFGIMKAANPGATTQDLSNFRQMAGDQASNIDSVMGIAAPIIASIPALRKGFAGLEGGAFGALFRPLAPRIIAHQIMQSNQGMDPMAPDQAAAIASMITKDFAPIGDGLLRSRGFSTMQIGDLYSSLSLRGMTPRMDLGTRPGEAGFLQNVKQYAADNNLSTEDLNQVMKDPKKMEALAKKLDKGNMDRTRNQLSEYAKALGSLSDLFGPNAEIDQILGHLDDITGGGLSQLTPQKLTNVAMELREVSRATQVPLPKMMQMMQQSALLGEGLGIFSPTGGLLTTDANMAERNFRKFRRTGGDLEAGEKGQQANVEAVNKNLLGAGASEVGKRVSGLLTLLDKSDPNKLTASLRQLRENLTSNDPTRQLAGLRYVEHGAYRQELVHSGISTDTFLAENDVLNEANRAPSQREAANITLQLQNTNKLAANRYRLGERIRSTFTAMGKKIGAGAADDLSLKLGDEFLLAPTNAMGNDRLFELLSKQMGNLTGDQRKQLRGFTENLGAEYIEVMGGLGAMTPARTARHTTSPEGKRDAERLKNQIAMRKYMGDLTVGQQNLSDRMLDFITNTKSDDINFMGAAKAAFGMETLKGMADPQGFYQGMNKAAGEYFGKKGSAAGLQALLDTKGPGEVALAMTAASNGYQTAMLNAKTENEKKELTFKYKTFVAKAEEAGAGMQAMALNESAAKFRRLYASAEKLGREDRGLVSDSQAFDKDGKLVTVEADNSREAILYRQRKNINDMINLDQQILSEVFDKDGNVKSELAKGLTPEAIKRMQQQKKMTESHLEMLGKQKEKWDKLKPDDVRQDLSEDRNEWRERNRLARDPAAALAFDAAFAKGKKGKPSKKGPAETATRYDKSYFEGDLKFQDVLYDNLDSLSDKTIEQFTKEGMRLQGLGDKLTDGQVRSYFEKLQKRVEREKAKKQKSLGDSLGNEKTAKAIDDGSGADVKADEPADIPSGSPLGDPKVAGKTKLDDSTPIKVEITNLKDLALNQPVPSNMGNV